MREAGIIIGLAILIASNEARAREFRGYDCSDDCSGHAAGCRWAEAHSITDESNYPLRGAALSFYEGCLVYVEDPSRGADEDDDGRHRLSQALTGGFRILDLCGQTRWGRRMADQSIDKREQYVAFATHCLQLAKVATDLESRATLREMAAEWLKLAEVTG